MSLIHYQGISASGEKLSGSWSGTKQDLLSELQQQGAVLTSLKEETKALAKGRFAFADFRNDIEQLHYLLASGIQIDKAVQLLVKNSRKTAGAQFWGAALTQLKDGVQFSQALKKAAEITDFALEEFYHSIISVGEEVGNLHQALQGLLEHLDFKGSLLKEVKSALAYPLFLLTASLLTAFFVLGFILPRFSSVYSAKEIAQLPLLSRYSLSLGNYFNANMGNLLIGLLVVAVVAFLAFSDARVRRFSMQKFLDLPLLRDVILKIELANLFSSLGTMLASGVELSRAIQMSERMVGNRNLRNIISETSSELKKGQPISAVWSRHALIPGDVIALVVAGESGARLGEVFTSLGKKFMERFKTQVSLLLTFLEPAIIVLLGGFIGMIVVSIMLAVVSMSDFYG